MSDGPCSSPPGLPYQAARSKPPSALKPHRLAAAVTTALLAAAPAAQAQEAGEAASLSPTVLDTLIVTGTRIADRTVAESQSPIDIITPEALSATGTTELATALARALPSLN